MPCEIASSTYATGACSTIPTCTRGGWVARNDHADLGTVEHVAMPFSFSVSDRQNLGGSPVTGQHQPPGIPGELGYADAEIDELVAAGVVRERSA